MANRCFCRLAKGPAGTESRGLVHGHPFRVGCFLWLRRDSESWCADWVFEVSAYALLYTASCPRSFFIDSFNSFFSIVAKLSTFNLFPLLSLCGFTTVLNLKDLKVTLLAAIHAWHLDECPYLHIRLNRTYPLYFICNTFKSSNSHRKSIYACMKNTKQVILVLSTRFDILTRVRAKVSYFE